jgi:hypothetical protein
MKIRVLHRVGQVTRVSPSSSADQRIDQVCLVDQVRQVDSTEKKTGGSNRVANMEVRVTENSANTESWVKENLANMESRVVENLANTENQATENSANTENQVTEDSVNMGNWVMQDSGARNQKKKKVLLQAKG